MASFLSPFSDAYFKQIWSDMFLINQILKCTYNADSASQPCRAKLELQRTMRVNTQISTILKKLQAKMKNCRYKYKCLLVDYREKYILCEFLIPKSLSCFLNHQNLTNAPPETYYTHQLRIETISNLQPSVVQFGIQEQLNSIATSLGCTFLNNFGKTTSLQTL